MRVNITLTFIRWTHASLQMNALLCYARSSGSVNKQLSHSPDVRCYVYSLLPKFGKSDHLCFLCEMCKVQFFVYLNHSYPFISCRGISIEDKEMFLHGTLKPSLPSTSKHTLTQTHNIFSSMTALPTLYKYLSVRILLLAELAPVKALNYCNVLSDQPCNYTACHHTNHSTPVIC